MFQTHKISCLQAALALLLIIPAAGQAQVTARFVMEPDVPLSIHGDINLATNPGDEVDLTIELSELPPSGATVVFAVDGQWNYLEFTNQIRQTITIAAPEVAAGDYHAIRNLSIIGVDGLKTESEDVGLIAFNGSALMGGANCFGCAFAYMGSLVNSGYCHEELSSCSLVCNGKSAAGQEAPLGSRSSEDDLTILRNYRDNVLLSTPVGEYYVQLHEDLKMELVQAVLADPTLVARGKAVWDEWVPVADALVQNQGESTVITQAMMDNILGLMDGLEAAGSATLGQALTDLREGMGLDDGPPASAAEFQVRVESSSTPVISQPWDGVKALYR